MKYLLITLALLLFTGCNIGTQEKEIKRSISYSLPKENIPALADFILTCAKNANPMSDEEGEDLVKQCEKTGNNLYQVRSYGFCHTTEQYCSYYDVTPCSMAVTKEEKLFCKRAQTKG